MTRARRLRSLLFVPGDRPDRIAKAIAAGPDGVVVDLQDAVHPDRLQTAREQAVTALRDAAGASVLRTVRVHRAGHDAFAADVDAANARIARRTLVKAGHDVGGASGG